MLLLSTLLFAQAQSNLYAGMISLKLDNAPLEKALLEIAHQGNFQLAYSRDLIPADKKISCELDDVSLNEAVNEVLQGTDLTLYSSTAGHMVLTPAARAQVISGTIRGTITDEKTGEKLIGANVMIEGTTLGTATDLNGYFRITKVPPGSYNLIIRYMGYKKMIEPVKVVANETANTDVTLTPSVIDLDEIIVTGSISGREKRAIANPTTTISAKDIERMPIDDIKHIFEGKIPGGFSMDPGYSFRDMAPISLRGSQTSMGGSTGMKVLIDGIEMSSMNTLINSLDYNNIEKIEVLRGPMASTLYGSGASGGVIQIFTKKGRKGTKIRLKSYFTVTPSPWVDDTPIGQFYNLYLSGGTSDYGYNIGLHHSKEDMFYPSNDIDTRLRVNAGAFAKFDQVTVDLRTSYNTTQWARMSHPDLVKLGEERGWTIQDSWREIPTYKQRTSPDHSVGLNLTHVISPNWFHRLSAGYNSTSYAHINTDSSAHGGYYRTKSDIISKYNLKWFTNTKQNLGSDFTVDITAGLEQTMYHYNSLVASTIYYSWDDVYVARFKPDYGYITDFNYISRGYFAETVLGYKNNLFLTTGVRIDDHEFYGDKFGAQVDPRVGLSYVAEYGPVLAKPRISYGSSTRAPAARARIHRETSRVIYLANPDLGPETQTGYEIGLDFYYGNNISFEATYYDQIFENGIVLETVDDPQTPKTERQYQNFDEIFNKGWEFAGKAIMHPFTVNAVFSIIDSRYGEIDAASTSFFAQMYRKDSRALWIPKHTGSLEVFYKVPPLFAKSGKGGNIGLGIFYTGAMRAFNELRSYDGYYHPDIPYVSYSDPEAFVEKEGYFIFRLAGNYWIQDYLNLTAEIDDLTENPDKGFYGVNYK